MAQGEEGRRGLGGMSVPESPVQRPHNSHFMGVCAGKSSCCFTCLRGRGGGEEGRKGRRRGKGGGEEGSRGEEKGREGKEEVQRKLGYKE